MPHTYKASLIEHGTGDYDVAGHGANGVCAVVQLQLHGPRDAMLKPRALQEVDAVHLLML